MPGYLRAARRARLWAMKDVDDEAMKETPREELERLRIRAKTATDELEDSILTMGDHLRAVEAEMVSVQAERDRYRRALERIATPDLGYAAASVWLIGQARAALSDLDITE